MDTELLQTLRNLIQSVPVIAVLIYVWRQAERRLDQSQARYRQLNKVYRESLRAEAGLMPETDIGNGDLADVEVGTQTG